MHHRVVIAVLFCLPLVSTAFVLLPKTHINYSSDSLSRSINRRRIISSQMAAQRAHIITEGEAVSFSSPDGPISARSKVLATWGVLGVLLMIGNAIKRLMPIALQPFYSSDFTSTQWTLYISWALIMSYAEGFKGFHQKFSPLVVRRSFTLEQNVSLLNVLFAWAYSMGLYSATKKRMIVSWAITGGVMLLVILVKSLTYPWRSIMDGGVVAGLTLGSLSIVYHYVLAMCGRLPDVDPCIVEPKRSD